MSGCRISKVTDKRTGRSLSLLRDARPTGKGAEIIRHAREIAEMCPDLEAFVVVGIGRDGGFTIGWASSDLFGPSLLCVYASEIMRRKISTQTEAVSVLNREKGFLDE